jgi:hypothetical protein
MVQDIGYLLFKEVLGMTEYPGGVFSGVILKDLVMFFLIPSIFIILVIYMLLARLVPIDSKGMRLLVGIGAYLFIVFGGYYSIFARISGPYFIFLIFILGLLYFLLSHFKGGGGGPYTARSGGGYAAEGGSPRQAYVTTQEGPSLLNRQELRKRLEFVDAQLKKSFGQRNELMSKSAPGIDIGRPLQDINQAIRDFEKQKLELEMQIYPHKKYSINW